MFKFIGLFNAPQPNLEKKILGMEFVSIYNKGQTSLYFDSEKAIENYASKNDVHLVFNGNLANTSHTYKALVEVSDQKNDLTFILSKYLQRGMDALDYLDGSFALALWDNREQKLYLCRDDNESKLLYYFISENNGLYYSNDLGILVRLCKSPEISQASLFEYLRFLDISAPYTIYDKVFFLGGDKILTAGAQGIKKKSKQVVNPDFSQKLKRVEKNCLNDFDKIFRETIKKKLELKPNSGVFLSGGIDSTLVCAVAASIRKDITAVTIGFNDPKLDESSVARNITDYLGIKHDVWKFDDYQDYQSFQDFTSKIPSPFADPAIIPTFQCFKKISGEIDMMLDGTGADTLIGIMPARYVHVILNYTRKIPETVRKAIASLLNFNKVLGRYSDLFSYEDAAEVMIRWKGWTQKEISELCGQPCDLSHTMFYKLYRENYNISPYELYSMLMSALPDDRIHQSSAIYGPEVVFPFFDRNVRAYVKQLPMRYRYRDEEPKYLFRQLLEKYVPKTLWDVPKHGFDYPIENLMRYNNCTLIKEYLSPVSLGKHGMFDTSIVDKHTSRFLKGDTSVKFKLWSLVLFQSWFENYFERI